MDCNKLQSETMIKPEIQMCENNISADRPAAWLKFVAFVKKSKQWC